VNQPADLYKLLQVDEEADTEVIQAAYRRLAQRYHPDSGAGDPARMAALNEAWAILRDPARRAEYDAQRAAERATAAERAAAGATGPARPSTPGVGRDRPPAAWPQGTAVPPGARTAHETTSPDWTTGRSTRGGGYDPARMRAPEGHGAAGPPPGRPSGSVLNFGRYAGWSLGEIARHDLDYLEWLDRTPIGRPYQAELDALLRAAGRRRTASRDEERRGLFRRR
jgi:curved DNA-binding protein CbpA